MRPEKFVNDPGLLHVGPTSYKWSYNFTIQYRGYKFITPVSHLFIGHF